MRKISVTAVIVLLAVIAIGCSSSSSGKASSSDSAIFNVADVTFVSSMIPHHQQAVEMADMAIARSQNAQVLDLAERIKAAQGPEITKMQGWLKQWGQAASSDTGMGSGMHADSSSMDTGMSSSDGMMTKDEMSKLDVATGAEFDKLFLAGMITHHQGAVTMAQTELTAGQSRDAQALATAIIKAQQAEIAEMKKLRTTVG